MRSACLIAKISNWSKKPKDKINYVDSIKSPTCTGVQFPPSPQIQKYAPTLVGAIFVCGDEQVLNALAWGN